MKKTNKILSLLLAICTIFTLLSFGAAAAQTEISGGKDMASATSVPSFGVTYASSLTEEKEEGWFKFTATVTGNYKIFIKNYNIPATDGNRLCIDVCDKYYQRIAYANEMWPNDSREVSCNLEGNIVYYIRVYNSNNWRKCCYGNYGFSITAPENAKQLSSISVTKPTKTTYNIGDSLNTSGMVVTAKFSDNSTQTVTDYKVSGFDSSSAGTKTVTVSYTYSGVTKTATFSVTVNKSGGTDEPGGGTGENTGEVISNIVTVINNIFVTIKTPFESLLDFILGLFNSIIK